MRVYRPLRTDGGESKPARRWYIELKDHNGVVRRFAGYPARTRDDEALTKELGRKIELLIEHRGAGRPLPADLYQWAVSVSPKLKERFVELGLLDRTTAEAGKGLAEHIEAFRNKQRAGFKPKLKTGCTDTHVQIVCSRIGRIVDGCGFQRWRDIDLDRVQDFLKGLGLSDATYNYYVRDFGRFIAWMLRMKRADGPPTGELPRADKEDREDKRSFILDELHRLITTTATKGETRQGCTARDRAVLYVVAAETGFRAKELMSLRVNSFDLDDASVTISREAAKDRKAATLPLKAKRARQLKAFFEGRSPRDAAFPMHKYAKLHEAIEPDLRDARAQWIRETKNGAERRRRWKTDFLSYIDADGRKGSFHALRKTFCTNLDATDASLAERMTLARHSMKGNLTLGTYTQVRAYNLKRVVEQLPDLPFPGDDAQAEVMRATGTDDYSGASNGALAGESRRTLMNSDAQRPAMTAEKPHLQSSTGGAKVDCLDRKTKGQS